MCESLWEHISRNRMQFNNQTSKVNECREGPFGRSSLLAWRTGITQAVPWGCGFLLMNKLLITVGATVSTHVSHTHLLLPSEGWPPHFPQTLGTFKEPCLHSCSLVSLKWLVRVSTPRESLLILSDPVCLLLWEVFFFLDIHPAPPKAHNRIQLAMDPWWQSKLCPLHPSPQHLHMLDFFLKIYCVCTCRVYIHTFNCTCLGARGVFRCPVLWHTTLFSWGKISYWIET